MNDIKRISIRFDLDNELHRKAWALLQKRDMNIYPTYSHAVISSLAELVERQRL